MKKFTLMFPVIILQCSPVASQTTKDAYSALLFYCQYFLLLPNRVIVINK